MATCDTEIILEEVVVTEILTEGIQGPPGPPGGTVIGGLGVVVSNIGDDDVLAVKNGAWVNKPQTQLTDGGNF